MEESGSGGNVVHASEPSRSAAGATEVASVADKHTATTASTYLDEVAIVDVPSG